MTIRSCLDLAELRSAFVDGALASADRDRLLVHLAGCSACAHDVAELREVRQLLSARTEPVSSPSHLPDRLVSIAGSRAADPLWVRPFRRAAAGSLPSPRRQARLRVTAAVVAAGAVVSLGGAAGYVAAPGDRVVAFDPASAATAEFVSAMAGMPLATDAVEALLSTDVQALRVDPTQIAPLPIGPNADPLSSADAAQVLQKAVASADEVSYRGTQVLHASRTGQAITATVDVEATAGEGRLTRVTSRDDVTMSSSFRSADLGSRLVDDEVVDLIADRWLLAGWNGTTVAGRVATVIEARWPDQSRTLAARWWVDDPSGLLLYQQSFDVAGAVVLSAGFSDLQIGTSEQRVRHLPPRLTVSATGASLTVSAAEDLQRSGWVCPQEVAGLALLRLHTDRLDDPDIVHAVYTDGLSSVSVVQQRGRLDTPPAGTVFDPVLRGWVRAGSPAVATWVSGRTVITTVTDGSPELLTQVVNDLPHDEPQQRTTLERVRAGWVRIVESLNG